MIRRTLFGVGCQLGSSVRSASRLRVVLDLDECLVHSVMDDSEYRQVEERKQVRLSVQGISTAKLRCQDGVEFHMHQRPGVNEFLQELSSFTDVYGFTAGTKVYAASAFQQLDPNKELFKHIWYRDSCTQYKLVYKKQTHIIYCKDLCKVFKAEFAPERTCLVDNNPISFVTHPSNGIPIEPFYDNPQDMELSAVLDLLHVLNEESDVRPILKDLFKLHEKVPRIAG